MLIDVFAMNIYIYKHMSVLRLRMLCWRVLKPFQYKTLPNKNVSFQKGAIHKGLVGVRHVTALPLIVMLTFSWTSTQSMRWKSIAEVHTAINNMWASVIIALNKILKRSAFYQHHIQYMKSNMQMASALSCAVVVVRLKGDIRYIMILLLKHKTIDVIAIYIYLGLFMLKCTVNKKIICPYLFISLRLQLRNSFRSQYFKIPLLRQIWRLK